jgi:ketosteroid isomerase-like protein
MNSRRLAIVLIGALLALTALGWNRSAIQAQTSDPAAVDAAFKKAFLAGDLNAVIALFSDDAVETNPFGVFNGKAAIRAGDESIAAQNPGQTTSFGDTVVVLDTAIHRGAIASDPLRAAGVSRIWVIETLVVFQGKIVSLSVIPDISDAETLKFVLASSGGR